MGGYAAGMAELQRALLRAQEVGSLELTSTVHGLSAMTLLFCGDPHRAIGAARKTVEVAEQSGLWFLVRFGLGFQASAEAWAGQFEAAEATMARVQAISQELGQRLVFEDWFLAAKAQIALGMGRIQEALDLAEQAVVIAQELDSLAGEATALATWGQALSALEPPCCDEAEARFAECLRLIEAVPSPPVAAHTHLVWGTLCRDRGDLAAAREHWEQAAALWEACGITWQVEKARALIETLQEA
jgi:tetratricopeptide (TPR) repeat protein